MELLEIEYCDVAFKNWREREREEKNDHEKGYQRNPQPLGSGVSREGLSRNSGVLFTFMKLIPGKTQRKPIKSVWLSGVRWLKRVLLFIIDSSFSVLF